MRRPTGDDDSLLQRAVRGEAACFTELVRRHRPWVCRLLSAMTSDLEAAEDLTQEVFTRLHRHGSSYKGRGQFVAYLKQLALNVGRSYLRRIPGVTLVAWDEQVEPRSELSSDLLDAILTQQVQSEVRASVEALPTDQRMAVLLHYFGGWTIPEIAVRMQCPEGTVKSRLFHGVRKIREALTSTTQKEEQEQ
ncbi:RNA polymerase sigma factor [Armatimonas sp.]|uniref:RNA polymerase sigma factor n=1 Tax=Armatimonas sp. TaxID=1872638 RepID=UPI00286C84B2|nr:RNA polymerase sigma factor [Armatimonas sp.]